MSYGFAQRFSVNAVIKADVGLRSMHSGYDVNVIRVTKVNNWSTMKRSLASLLDYDASDEDDTKAEEAVRPQRKRYESNSCPSAEH
jgi:hypothetical protein